MTHALEIELSQLLNRYQNPKFCAKELLVNWQHQLSDPKDINLFCDFLMTFGLYQELFDFVIALIENNKKFIPWAYLAETIFLINSKPDPKLVLALFEGAKEHGDLIELSYCTYHQQIDPDLVHVLKSKKNQIQIQYQLKKQEAFDQLKLYKVQQLFEEEKKILDKLQRQFPHDLQVQEYINQSNEHKAQEVFSKNLIRKGPSASELRPKLSEQEKAYIKKIFDQAEMICKAQPDMAYDFAILLWQLEAYDFAQKILNLYPHQNKKEWLQIEILFEQRRFLDILTELAQIEKKYSHNADILSATHYSKAICYWELGHQALAIEIMNSIVQINPFYRAAQTYLSHWQKGSL